MSGLTLTHCETDVEPQCSVVFVLAGFETTTGPTLGRIEVVFEGCYYARVGPNLDTEGLESIGYEIDEPFEFDAANYLSRRTSLWRESGFCPKSGFYAAIRSAWLAGLPDRFRLDSRHYLLDGQDGYVELIARRFRCANGFGMRADVNRLRPRAPWSAKGG